MADEKQQETVSVEDIKYINRQIDDFVTTTNFLDALVSASNNIEDSKSLLVDPVAYLEGANVIVPTDFRILSEDIDNEGIPAICIKVCRRIFGVDIWYWICRDKQF